MTYSEMLKQLMEGSVCMTREHNHWKDCVGDHLYIMYEPERVLVTSKGREVSIKPHLVRVRSYDIVEDEDWKPNIDDLLACDWRVFNV